MYQIPILFIIFKRKDVAMRSFERIRQLKPSKLYIASDGPRAEVEHEDELVRATRESILSAIDWECDVHQLFQTKNLGCGLGVYTAISWLFENEDMGIILEDDCVADPSFFVYAEELLQTYYDDQRIGMIAGTNQVAHYSMPYSYCFSKYAACWGWATWRRAWKHMDIDMHFLKDCEHSVLKNRGYQGKEVGRWKYQLRTIRLGRVSAWDWQWYFSLASQNQLCIFPCRNLISNIGNDQFATHTSLSNTYIESHPLSFPLSHPAYICPDTDFDRAFFKTDNNMQASLKRMMPYGLKQFLKRHIR